MTATPVLLGIINSSDKGVFQATIILYFTKPLLVGLWSDQSEICPTLVERYASAGQIELVREIKEETK